MSASGASNRQSQVVEALNRLEAQIKRAEETTNLQSDRFADVLQEDTPVATEAMAKKGIVVLVPLARRIDELANVLEGIVDRFRSIRDRCEL